jgi:hypothetical protein
MATIALEMQSIYLLLILRSIRALVYRVLDCALAEVHCRIEQQAHVPAGVHPHRLQNLVDLGGDEGGSD